MKSPVNVRVDESIVAALIEKDEILGGLIRQQGTITVPVFDDHFYSLVMSIVYQQLSFKAAETIFNRLLNHVNHEVTPQRMAQIDADSFRQLGISRQKVKYIHDICRHFLELPEKFNALHQLADEEVIALLTDIKGVGQWTAQMFLMFTLMRPDVFPVADLGIRKAMRVLYQLPDDEPVATYETLAHRWKPFRSYACHYLWHSHDN